MKEPTATSRHAGSSPARTAHSIHISQIARHAGCGFLMGGADVIPGVSGGTVALVLGIYQRLIIAISHCDRRLFSLVKRRQWGAIAAHLDLSFLVSLGAGILLGVVTLGGAMNELLTSPTTRPYALAALFGLIGASIVVVAKMVKRSRPAHGFLPLVCGVLGAALALGVTQLTAGAGNYSLPYVFVSGTIAICAMILPGISGAYLLLILGLYDHITGILKALPRGQATPADLVTLTVFAAGCGIGLISFSKLLRWLLQHFQGVTLALLCGFMVGAMSKVWPFQNDLTPDVEKLSHKHFENVLPNLDGELLMCTLIAVVLFAAVLLLESAANKSIRTKPGETTGSRA